MKYFFSRFMITLFAITFGTSCATQIPVTKKKIDDQYTNRNTQEFANAVQNGDITGIDSMLKNGFDLNSLANDGNTYLNIAYSSKKLETMQYLLENGANINLQDQNGVTLLNFVAFIGDLDITKYLIENGADPKIVSENFNPVLIAASERGHLDIVKYLLEKGIDINTKDRYGCNSLIWVIMGTKDINVFNLLIEKGIDMNSVGGGRTALHEAISKNELNYVKILIENGADSTIKQFGLKSTLQLAKEQNNQEIIKFLEEKGIE